MIGIFFVSGDYQHLAVELFRGRIRVSYDVGNNPVSTMFRSVFANERTGNNNKYSDLSIGILRKL